MLIKNIHTFCPCPNESLDKFATCAVAMRYAPLLCASFRSIIHDSLLLCMPTKVTRFFNSLPLMVITSILLTEVNDRNTRPVGLSNAQQ